MEAIKKNYDESQCIHLLLHVDPYVQDENGMLSVVTIDMGGF